MPQDPQFFQLLGRVTEETFGAEPTLTNPAGEVVRLSVVLEYNRKAEGPLRAALEKLDHMRCSSLGALLEVLYLRALPFLIRSGVKNPVHHIPHALSFMASIVDGEDASADTVRRGMIAILLHDVGLAEAVLPKITERHLRNTIREVVEGRLDMDALRAERERAVTARDEHMQKGADIARGLLAGLVDDHPGALDSEDIDEIVRIVRHHDDPKVPMLDAVIGRELGSRGEWNCRKERLVGIHDWLLQYHREADSLWMVTRDGIDADLARFMRDTRPSRAEIIENNMDLLQSEAAVYAAFLPRDLVERYEFIEGSLFRSRTGHALFRSLVEIL